MRNVRRGNRKSCRWTDAKRSWRRGVFWWVVPVAKQPMLDTGLFVVLVPAVAIGFAAVAPI